MHKFETIAKYDIQGGNSVVVKGDQMIGARQTLITAPHNELEPTAYDGGAMSIEAVQPDIFVLRDMSEGRRPLVSVMLVHAAFHNILGQKHAVTTVPPGQQEKINLYTDLGFQDKGLTRNEDDNGVPLEQETILVNSDNVRLASKALLLTHSMVKATTRASEPISPKWRDDYGN